MSSTKTVAYELVRLPKHSIELAQEKRKIERLKEENRDLKEVVRDLKIILAAAKAKGFSHANRVSSEAPQG